MYATKGNDQNPGLGRAHGSGAAPVERDRWLTALPLRNVCDMREVFYDVDSHGGIVHVRDHHVQAPFSGALPAPVVRDRWLEARPLPNVCDMREIFYSVDATGRVGHRDDAKR